MENSFKQCRNKHFSMRHAVFSGTSWQCFAIISDIQQELVILAGTDKCLTSLKMNSIHFEGRRSLQTTKKTFDSPHYMPCLCWHSIHLVASSGVDATRCKRYKQLRSLLTAHIPFKQTYLTLTKSKAGIILAHRHNGPLRGNFKEKYSHNSTSLYTYVPYAQAQSPCFRK